MRTFLQSLLITLSLTSFSQGQFNSNDMTVTKPDMEINTYPQDTTANALMIYEHGKSYVDKNTYKLKTEVSQKLKILNRKGFEKAQISIYLYKDGNKKESISNISAITHNLENNTVTRTPLEKNQIFEENYNENYTIVKFTFPNIKEGSVISYHYTLESPYMFKYREWYFQSDIPTLYSQYQASIPGNYIYNIKLVGFLKLAVDESVIEEHCLEGSGGASAHCSNYNYVMKDIPAFIEEDYMTTATNYLSRVEYELQTFKGFDGTVNNYTKTWKSVDSELKSDKDIGRQLNKSSALKGLIEESIVNEKDPLEKAKAIYRYVQNTYTWNGKYDIFKEVSIKDLIDHKSGKVSEINILLHNLLNEHGIAVMPVLLSTRNNGFATKIFPVLSDFNYMIVQATIDGKSYLLDATEKYASFGELPFRCLNQYGRLLDFKAGSYWIDINASSLSSVQYQIEANLEASGIVKSSVTKRTSGYHALPLKKAYSEDMTGYIKSQKERYDFLEFSDYTVKTIDKTNFEFDEEFNITLEPEVIGGKIYMNPFLFKFFSENLFKLQQRTYPIDFGYKDSYLFSMKFKIDEGYDIVDYPKSTLLRLPNSTGSLTMNTRVQNNTVELYLKLSFNESIYNPEFYEYIKSFMDSTVDIQKNSLIVLQKK